MGKRATFDHHKTSAILFYSIWEKVETSSADISKLNNSQQNNVDG